jgi:hypothetical protein
MENGVATGIACTISASGDNCNDSGSVTIDGDLRVSIRDTPTSSPENRETGYAIAYSNEDGEFFFGSHFGQLIFSVSDGYYPASTGKDGPAHATESDTYADAFAFTETGIAMYVTTAPGVGTSWVLDFRDDGADESCDVALSGTAVTATDTCSDSVAVGSDVNFRLSHTGVPAIPTYSAVSLSGTLP